MEQAVACRARQFHSVPAQEQATGMTNVRWQGQSSETHAAASLLVGKGPPQHKHATDREEPERPGFHNERGYPGGEHIWLSGELNCRSQKDQQKNKGLGAEEAPPSASAPDFRAWRAQIESPRPDDRVITSNATHNASPQKISGCRIRSWTGHTCREEPQNRSPTTFEMSRCSARSAPRSETRGLSRATTPTASPLNEARSANRHRPTSLDGNQNSCGRTPMIIASWPSSVAFF